MGMTLTSCEFCKNCKFYIAYYTKEKNRFKTVMGRCTNEEISARNRRNIFVSEKTCEFREQDNDKTCEQNKTVREIIFKMQEQLTQIVELLENEE